MIRITLLLALTFCMSCSKQVPSAGQRSQELRGGSSSGESRDSAPQFSVAGEIKSGGQTVGDATGSGHGEHSETDRPIAAESRATRAGSRTSPAVFVSSETETFPDWQMSVASDASVRIQHQLATVVDASYAFWGPKWKWAGARFKTGQTDGSTTQFTGEVKALGLHIAGQITQLSDNALKFHYRLSAERELNGVIGGGMEWKLKLDSPSLAEKMFKPVLLENNAGWKWPTSDGQAITVTIEPPAAHVYFERGRKSTIRSMLVGEQLQRGTAEITMTVQLPEGGHVVLSASQRYGPADTSGWYRDALLWNASPVDLSFLNAEDRPAGQHGFVRADGDRLVFEDGTPVRFWGGNLAAYALFADKDAIRQQARRIAQLGFNLMRLHHHDSTRWVSPTVIDKRRDDSQHFDTQGLDRIDWWIKCLKDEGVYVWLDMHVGRQFKPGDEIEGFDELKRRNGEGKGFCYFNERVRQLMQDFQAAYLKHVNPYTKLAYKDDPAIMGLLITNENDLVHHFGNLMLPDKKNPCHNALFTKAARAFAQKTRLPYDRVWRTWEPGPSKLFLIDMEHRFNTAMLTHLERLGVRVPVATTNDWGRKNLCALPSLCDGGIIDVHSYGKPEALSVNPHMEPNWITRIGAAQVAGKPLSITEWNVPYPAVDRFTAPLYVAAMASLQGWDAPMLYNYSQRPFQKPTRPSQWSAFPDPAIMGMMPAAAIAFRQGHVSPARQTYCLKLKPEDLYFRDLNPATSATIRTLVEQSRLTIGLPDTKQLDWDGDTLAADGARIVTDTDRDFLPESGTSVRSDTGEIERNWRLGVQIINTLKTQAANGWIGGRAIQLGDVSFDITTPKATVCITSLDGQPIGSSRRLLITAMARVLASPGGKMPFLSEPVAGALMIRSHSSGLHLVPLSCTREELEPMSAKQQAGVYRIPLPPPRGTHWFLLED